MSTQIFQGLSFLEIVERLQDDRNFSNLFEAFALEAAVNGLDSPGGRVLLRFFAKNEEELEQLVANSQALAGVLTVNRRGTVEGTAPETSGITTTGSTALCEVTGFNRLGFAALTASRDNGFQPQPQPNQ